MTDQEILQECDEMITLMGSNAQIGMIMLGKWGKTNTREFCPGGPTGHIVSDNLDGPGIIVFFNAKEVKEFLTNNPS